MAAFAAAGGARFDIELDVRPTKCDVRAAFHDADLRRLPDSQVRLRRECAEIRGRCASRALTSEFQRCNSCLGAAVAIMSGPIDSIHRLRTEGSDGICGWVIGRGHAGGRHCPTAGYRSGGATSSPVITTGRTLQLQTPVTVRRRYCVDRQVTGSGSPLAGPRG